MASDISSNCTETNRAPENQRPCRPGSLNGSDLLLISGLTEFSTEHRSRNQELRSSIRTNSWHLTYLLEQCE